MAHILILEDEIALSSYWQDILESHGHQVICCPSVTQAIEQASTKKFDLIIADMLIKNQKSGQFEKQGGLTLIAQKDIGKIPRVPILAVSGYKPKKTFSISPLQSAANMGADLTLYKPIRSETLLQAINTLLNSG